MEQQVIVAATSGLAPLINCKIAEFRFRVLPQTLEVALNVLISSAFYSGLSGTTFRLVGLGKDTGEVWWTEG